MNSVSVYCRKRAGNRQRIKTLSWLTSWCTSMCGRCAHQTHIVETTLARPFRGCNGLGWNYDKVGWKKWWLLDKSLVSKWINKSLDSNAGTAEPWTTALHSRVAITSQAKQETKLFLKLTFYQFLPPLETRLGYCSVYWEHLTDPYVTNFDYAAQLSLLQRTKFSQTVIMQLISRPVDKLPSNKVHLQKSKMDSFDFSLYERMSSLHYTTSFDARDHTSLRESFVGKQSYNLPLLFWLIGWLSTVKSRAVHSINHPTANSRQLEMKRHRRGQCKWQTNTIRKAAAVNN